MATVKRYETGLRTDWDAFVARNAAASYGHLSANCHLAGASAQRSVMLYEDGALVAILPLFETSCRRLRTFRVRELVSGLYFPAGPLFAPACTEKTRRRLSRELIGHVGKIADDLGVDRIRIAYPNVIGDAPGITALGCLPLRDHGYHEANIVSRLLPLRADPCGLQKQMRERGRRWLRKAGAAGVRVMVIETPAQWEACYDLNDRTMGDLAWPRQALNQIWHSFIAAGHATAFAAILDDAIIGAVVVVHMNRSAYYWLGWNAERAASVGANYASLWEAILYCKARGAEWFELGSDGGATAKLRNIAFFKAAFGGQLHYSLVGIAERRRAKAYLLEMLESGISGLRRWRDRPIDKGSVDDN